MRIRFYHWWALDLFHRLWGPLYAARPEIALLHGQMLMLAALSNPKLPKQETDEDESSQSSE